VAVHKVVQLLELYQIQGI